ncbi:MAG: hypothetical protein GXP25_01115 [Planctomycetes bacterium]|nr:hypothetical protein [Planctomycetota bacterium]
MEMNLYQEWLDIPPDQQPPNHYQLLGVQQFEPNTETIEKAARARAALLKTYEIGKYSAQSQVLLTEVARARADLLNPKRKVEYDRRLRGGEKAPQIEVDSLEIFTNLVAFSMLRGNLSKEHLASLFAEAKRLKVPQPKAQAIIQPMLLQAKQQRAAETAAREKAEQKKEREERAARRRAGMKKAALVIVILAIMGAGGYYALRFKKTVEEEKKVEQAERQESQEKNQCEKWLVKAARAQREEKWTEATDFYQRALDLGAGEGAKTKLAAMKNALGAIQFEREKKWAAAAAAYKKAGEGMGDPNVFKKKLGFLALAQEYDAAYAEGETKQKAGQLKEAFAAFQKAAALAAKAKLKTDAPTQLASLKDTIERRRETIDRAKHLLDIASDHKDYSALYAAASFYLSSGGPDGRRSLAAETKAAAEKVLKTQPKPEVKPESLLAGCARIFEEKGPYPALREIGKLQYYFGNSRVCKDAAYQTELLGKVGKKTPKTLNEMLTRCVVFGETLCPDCMGSGRLPCRLCNDTGKIKVTCDACNGRGRVRGCDKCKGTGLQLGPCPECKGTGTWKCPRCRGRGCKFCQNNPKRPCTACKGTGTAPTRKKCPRCHGKGKIAGKTCPACKGRGKPICDACQGTGMKPCKKCNGTGKILVPCPRCSRGRYRKCLKCGGTGQLKGK